MEEKDFEYSYDIPAGFIEIDPSHYEELGLKGYVKESTLNFFVKVENNQPVSSISVNRDAFLDEETTYDSLLDLNIKNLAGSGFEVVSQYETTRNDGTRLTVCKITGKNFKLVNTFTTLNSLFIGSSIIDKGTGEDEGILVNFMKSIKVVKGM